MTSEEKTTLKAACLQAATTLIAARDTTKGSVDLDECVKLAAELYCRVTAMNWQPGRGVGVDPPGSINMLQRMSYGNAAPAHLLEIWSSVSIGAVLGARRNSMNTVAGTAVTTK